MISSSALPPPSAWRAIVALMLREIATTYGRTPGGFVWAVAEPVAAIALLSYVFSLAFDAPPVGTSFTLFYATGYLPFAAFLDISNKTANALRFSRQLLAYPAVAALDAVLARICLGALTHVAIGVIVIVGIEIFWETGAVWHLPTLAVSATLALVLAAGAGIMNAALFARLPLWERLWQIAMRPMFVVSGIFFLMEDLPREALSVAWYNPLLHVTGIARAAALPGYDAPLASAPFAALFAILMAGLGLLLFRLFSKDNVLV